MKGIGRAYAVAATNVGFVSLAAGALGVLGAAGLNQGANYQIARTASLHTIPERAVRDVCDADRRARFVLAVIAGGPLARSAGLTLLASLGG